MPNKLFEAGKSYIADYAGNISGPYNTTAEAFKSSVTSDTILIAIPASTYNKKPKIVAKKNVTGIKIDFNKNTVTVASDEGSSATLNKVSYDVGVTEIDKEELKDWKTIIDDAFKICKTTIIIGKPPVEGECLDALLYL